METTSKPDYRWWARMEVWTLKQAALLLHSMDPNHYRSLKPYVNDLPLQYAELQKTYFVLHQFPWEEACENIIIEEKVFILLPSCI